MQEQSPIAQPEVVQERPRQVGQEQTRLVERERTRRVVQPRVLELGQLLLEQQSVPPFLGSLPEQESRL